jgi:hypothetical protein
MDEHLAERWSESGLFESREAFSLSYCSLEDAIGTAVDRASGGMDEILFCGV